MRLKHGKYISFRAPGQEQFTRAATIGSDYTEERIRERVLADKKISSTLSCDNDSIRQVIYIENSEKIKSSPGLLQWAKVENLKIRASSLIYLQKHGMASVDEFGRRYQSAEKNFSAAQKALTDTENRIKVLENLQTQIRHYARTSSNFVVPSTASIWLSNATPMRPILHFSRNGLQGIC